MLSPLLIVIGICFLGSAALIPIMYLGINGQASMLWIILSSTLFINLADLFWITVARKLGEQKIENWFFVRKNIEKFKKLEIAIQKHGPKILFLSKFIQGAGILSQLSAGLFRVNRWRAILANLLGSVVWTTTIFLIVKTTHQINLAEREIANIKLGTLILIILFSLIYFIGIKISKKEIDWLSK